MFVALTGANAAGALSALPPPFMTRNYQTSSWERVDGFYSWSEVIDVHTLPALAEYFGMLIYVSEVCIFRCES